MKSRKILAALLTLTLLPTVFVACTGSSETASVDTKQENKTESTQNKEESKKETGPTTIKVAVWDNSTNPVNDQIIAAFEEKNKDIKVELIDTPSAEYTNKLAIMLNGGTELDAFYIKDADTTLGMYNKGQLADLTEYTSRDNVDFAQYNGLAENFKFDGKIVGLPQRTDYYVLYYNKDLFDAAGVPYPSNDMTWAEFEETAKKLTSGEGTNKKYGALLHTWNACVQNWGVAEGEHTIVSVDYEFFRPYYEMALRMQNEDKSIMDYATMKTSNIHYSGPFLNGDIAMMPMGTWFMSTIIAKKDSGESNVNWGVAALPHSEKNEAGHTVGATTPVAINENSKKKDAAWEYVKFATSQEAEEMLAAAGYMPSISNDATLEKITTMEGMPEGIAEALKVKKIELDRPIVDKAAEVNKILGEEHGLIMLGEVSIDEGLATMKERVADLLK